MKITKVALYISSLSLLSLNYVSAAVLDIDPEPLLTKTATVKPNLMLMIDDSGSMGNSGSHDIFYTYGYDFNHEYECSLIDPLPADDNETVYVQVDDATGVPYFTYAEANTLYQLNDLPGSTTLPGSTDTVYKCENPDPNAKLDYCDGSYNTGTGYCSKWRDSSSRGYRWGFVGLNRKSGGTTGINDQLHEAIQSEYNTTITAAHCQGNGTGSRSSLRLDPITNRGRASSWYRFKTPMRFSSEIRVTPPIGIKNACFDPGASYKVRLKAKDCTSVSGYCTSDNTNSDNPVREVKGNFLNWYFSNSSTSAFDFNDTSGAVLGGYTYNLTPAPAWRFSSSTGYRVGTDDDQTRIDVAKDVAALLTAGTEDMFIGISSFDSGAGASIDLGLVELGDLDFSKYGSEDQFKNNRAELIKSIKNIVHDGGTPLAETWAQLALYFTHNGSSNGEKIQMGTKSKTPEAWFDDIGSSAGIVSALLQSDGSVKTTYYSDLTTRSTADIPAPMTQAKWCQKNYIVGLTDGKPSSETLDNDLKNYDVPTEVKVGGDDTYLDNVVAALFDNDLRPDIKKADGVSENKNNIKTYLIAFGDDVKKSDFDTIAGYGGGAAYSATDGQALADAFLAIKNDIAAQGQSLTGIAAAGSANLRTSATAYQAAYDTAFWTGNLKAFALTDKGLFTGADENDPSKTIISSTTEGMLPEWESQKVINNMYVNEDSSSYIGVDKRKIFTASGSSVKGGADFTYATWATLPASIQNDINYYAGTDTTKRKNLVNYLRGDVTNENFNTVHSGTQAFRQRVALADDNSNGKVDRTNAGGILGDIVNSSPIYVGGANSRRNNKYHGNVAGSYNAFEAITSNFRSGVIYAGGNDGMLHAFSVEGAGAGYPAGSEIFSYIPSFIASDVYNEGLHYLASKNYEHRFYVDVTPTIRDVYADLYYTSGAPNKKWRTVLVGGVGGGGKGIYALDVTCPIIGTNAKDTVCGSAGSKRVGFSKDNVLWEFTEAQSSHLGYTYGEPLITKLNYDSGKGASDPNGNAYPGRWAAVFNNGYNSDTGKAVLFVVFIDGPASGTWVEGVDYLVLHASEKGIRTESTIDKLVEADPSLANGLSAPVGVDYTGDGLTDRIYAGDLKGQMWGFNVKAAATSANYSNAAAFEWSTYKLFTAANNQAITTSPTITRDTARKDPEPHLMISFGTGLFLQSQDTLTDDVQTMYSVHDRGTANLTRTNLEPRYFESKSKVRYIVDKNGVAFGYGQSEVNYATQYGWYIDLYNDIDKSTTASTSEKLGERIVFRPVVSGNLLIFSTLTPTTSLCSGAASGSINAVNWKTGLADPEGALDINSDGVLDASDIGSVGIEYAESVGQIGLVEIEGVQGSVIAPIAGEGEVIYKQDATSGGAGKRISWEERFPAGIQ